jgi:gliding motility-associated-like protein
VQNATGTLSTVAPGRDWLPSWAVINEAWRFSPGGSPVTYAASSIPFAPIPYASSAIYWYNATTGVYLGTGPTLTVSPGSTTIYKAGGLGCADTSFGLYTVTPTPYLTFSVTGYSPTKCGEGDGYIVISGLVADSVDTVHYSVAGVPQPVYVGTVSPSGTLTINALSAGTITNIYITHRLCISLPQSVTIIDPPIAITGATLTPILFCGDTASIILHGLYPVQTYTLSYSIGGVPQPSVVVTTDAGGNIRLPGLLAGTYSNFVAFFGTCVTPLAGPWVLGNPPIAITSVVTTNPSICGACDGTMTLSGLYPSHVFTVTYSLGGVPQTPVSTSSNAAGTITLSGLCAGTYTNLIASFGVCATPPRGPYSIVDPPISISSIDPTNASFCGVCDGALLLHGLYPFHAFTVTYTVNGVPATPVAVVSGATGNILLTGLCAGMYTNVVATFGTCVTPPMGPYFITAPTPPLMNVVSSTNPTKCGYCDGTIKLKSITPISFDSVFFDFNGVPNLPVPSAALPDSSITLYGLCEGAYSNFTVKWGQCVYTVTGTATLYAPPITIAFNTGIQLGCAKDTVYFVNTSAPSSDLTYSWSFGDGAHDTAKNPVHSYAHGTYTATLTISNGVCTRTASTTLNLDHPLEASFVASPLALCQRSPVTFTNSSVGTGNTYKWYFGNGATDVASDPLYAFPRPGTYTVTLVATDFLNCHDTTQTVINVDSISGLKLQLTDSFFCAGSYVTFTGKYTDIGNTGVTWTVDNTDSMHNVNPFVRAFNPGTYTVSVTPHFRLCRDTTATKTITVLEQPGINLGDDTTICPGSGAFAVWDRSNSANPNASWRWSTGEAGKRIIVSGPDKYWVTVSIASCRATDTINVENDCFVSIPNVFTPNSDGINDYFFPRALLSRGLTSFHMTIYNRWGELLFETSSTEGRGWDGSFKGIMQPQGVYVYVIEAAFKDGQHEDHKGNVTLLK